MNFNSPTLQEPETGIVSILYQCQNCGAPVRLQPYPSITCKNCPRCGLNALHCEDIFEYRFTPTKENALNASEWLRVPDGCLFVLKEEPL
jgi:DNA-directed RNA polymerase subunit RPC12/RpoP